MTDDHLRAEEPPDTGDGDDGLFLRLTDWFRADRDASAAWRRDAREDYDFVAGSQWSEKDAQTLRDQGRPPITFNRTAPVIKSVGGSEVNNRQEIRYLPRQVGKSAINEVLSEAGKFFADESDAEDEESDAFQDAAICGMGWVETRIDYEIDPDGAYVEERLDPLEMFWDRAARGRNLKDARRKWRVRKLDKARAQAMFPDADPAELDAAWANPEAPEAHGNPLPSERHDDTREAVSDRRSSEVTLVHCQWWDTEPFYRMADPMTGQLAELSIEQFQALDGRAKAMGVQLQATRQTRRVYKQAWLGGCVLDVKPSLYPNGFTWSCITGDRDHNKGCWYGLVRPMKDPQRWANKWLSQYLHILNSNAKGGLMAERSAFEDQAQAEETWAKSDAITWMQDGALSQGKVLPKPMANLPQGHFQLLEFALSSIRDSSGVNLELLGMKTNDQAGVLEYQRKQAAMTILATLFDSLRRTRKMIGRVRLHYIQTFLADGRLVRVIAEDQQQYIPLAADVVAGKYDVVIDDAPASPNQKEVVWQAFQQILPAFKEMITPEVLMDVLEYSPLPTSFIEKLKQRVMQAQQNPEQDEAKKAGVDLVQAKALDHRASAAHKMAKAERESVIPFPTTGAPHG